MNKVISTKFGNASISPNGYYMITSCKEGNHRKYLHRLIYESFWGVKLPQGIIVHHKDGDKTNNCILNLEALHGKEHRQLHMAGKKCLDETKQKISNTKTKKYARIIKQGFNGAGNQRYAIKYYGEILKKSTNINKLELWFEKNYPNCELKKEWG